MRTSQFEANQCNGPANGFLKAGRGGGSLAVQPVNISVDIKIWGETYIFSFTLSGVPSPVEIAKSNQLQLSFY